MNELLVQSNRSLLNLTGMAIGQHLLEPTPRPMLVSPFVEIIEVEMAGLDIEDSLHVIDVLSA